MFTELSRYNNLNEVIAPDVKGRMLRSKSLRLTPVVTGEIAHSLEEKDRLDHLSYTYYREPGKWWRFCDANIDFLSPLALLGQEPVETTTFPVIYTGSTGSTGSTGTQPPWYMLIKQVKALPGVRRVLFQRQVGLVGKTVLYEGRDVGIHTEQTDFFLVVTYNRLKVTPGAIGAAIENVEIGSNKFRAREFQFTGRLGKNIAIPPDLVE
jgi:hypothetical protein